MADPLHQISDENQFWRYVFDAIQAGICLLDKDMNILRVNKWMENRYASKSPLIGKKCYSVYRNRSSECEHCPSRRTLASGKIESEHVLLKENDYTKGWIELISYPLKNDNGDLIGVIEYVTDATQRIKDEQLHKVMMQIAIAVHTASDTGALINAIRDNLGEILDTKNFYVALYDKTTDTISLPFFVDEKDHFDSFPAGKTLTALVIKSRKSMLLDEDEMLRLEQEGIIEPIGTSSKVWLGVPLFVNNEVLGVLAVQSYKDKKAYNERDLKILEFVSEQIGISIERKQAEEKFKFEQSLLNALMDNVPDYIFFKNEKSEFLRISKAHAEHFGLESPEQAVGKTDFDFFSRKHAQELFDGEQNIIKTGQPIVGKVEWELDSNGKKLWFSTTKAPLTNSEKVILGTFGVTRNITDHKLIEQELYQSELQNRLILNALRDSMHVIDENFTIVMANKALVEWNKTLQLADDVTGKYLFDVYPFLSSKVKEEYDVTFSNGLMHESEEMNIINNDRIFTETRKIPIKEDGKVKQVLTVIRDISKRKKSEEEVIRLAAAVEQSNESIIILDIEGIIKYVNPGFEKITGFNKQDVLNKSIIMLKNDQQDEQLYQTIWQSISKGQSWSGHLVNYKKDGSTYEEDVTISPIRNEKGEITNFLSVARDVTDEVRIQKQLVVAQKMKAIGTLAGGIAHDFNNILASIIGFTQLSISNVEQGSKIANNLQSVLKACDRARELTQQILLFSRGDEQEKKVLRIQDIINETLKLLKASLPSTIKINVNIKDQAFINANATQMHQVIMNLATNAYHAMQEFGGTLTLSVENIEMDEENITYFENLEPGKYIKLSVTDTGHGISPKNLDRIFDPFYSTKEGDKGSGLGLSVVLGIIKSHKGDITVASKEGEGTTFEIYLPRIEPIRYKTKTERKLPYPGGSERILYVDDETDLVFVGKQILERLGYSVITTSDSFEAFSIFQNKSSEFDLIITDQTMPNLTGAQLAKKIRETNKKIPIILCTGFSEQISENEVLKVGINKVLLKPFYIADISQTIREVLDN